MPLKLIGRINLDLWIVGLVVLFLLMLALFDGDVMIARYFFFDATTNEWIARHDWWANELLHTGGRNLMNLRERMKPWRVFGTESTSTLSAMEKKPWTMAHRITGNLRKIFRTD